MSAPQLSCWQCRRMSFDSGSPDYSEYTPGEDATITCHANHWKLSPYSSSDEDFRNAMATAATCPDFQDFKP